MAFENPLLKLSMQSRGWITLTSGFLLHFVLGVFYLWGSITVYTCSYLQQKGNNVTKDDAGAVFPFTFLAINIGTPFGVGLATFFGWKKYIFGASFLMGASVFISSFVLSNFILFVLFYGVIFGLLVGVLYMVPFNTCYLYFPHRKGLVSGVITGGFGFGSTVFIWLIFGIVNSNNAKPTQKINGASYFTQDIVDKYPESLRVLGICQIIIGCFSAFFHLRPTLEEAKAYEQKLHQDHIQAEKNSKQKQVEMTGQKNQYDVEAGKEIIENKEEENTQLQGQEASNKKNHQTPDLNEKNAQNNQAAPQSISLGVKDKETYYEFPTFIEGMKTKFIYISTFLTLCFTAYGTMVVSQYKNYGTDKGFDDSFLSAVGTVGSIMNGSARIIWGFLMEKFTVRQLLIVNLLCQITVAFTFRYVSSNQALFFIWILLGYFLYGAWLAIMPALINRVYGKKIGTQIYSITFFGFVAASFLQYFLVKELKKSIGWGDTFFVFGGIQILGFLVSFLVRFNAVPSQSMIDAKKSAVKQQEQVQTEHQPINAK